MNFLSRFVHAVLWLTGAALLVLGGWFAFVNSGTVAISLAPFAEPFQAPLYLAIAAPLYLGVVIGAVAVWLSGHRARKRARVEARRAEALARENAALRAKLDAPRPAPPESARADILTPPTLLP